MARIRINKGWQIAAIVVACLWLTGLLLLKLISPRLTSYVESDKFRAEMEKETAKGLHFPSAHFASIKRTGTWTAESAGFDADNGSKALRSIDAHGISAKFNPWGILLRRWQIDYIYIQSGHVAIQVYEPKPEVKSPKPWYAIFLPDRVYLKRVESVQPIDVTWKFREKDAGFFATHLLITPHGRDFEYQANGGELRMAPLANLRLQHTHLLITKTLLTLYDLDLQPREEGVGTIHAEGTAGTREDKSVNFRINFDRMPINQLLPNEWSEYLGGEATSRIHWQGENPKLEKSRGDMTLALANGRVTRAPFLQKLATLTGEKELQSLHFNECHFDVTWNYPQAQLTNLLLEDKGKIRAEGTLTLHDKELGGAIELGVARRLLSWLPNPEEVFPAEHDGYLWTTVHVTGTIGAPVQDLSPRLVEALKRSPTAALGILFRGLSDWLRDAFDRK